MAIKGEWVHYGDQIGYLAKAERASAPLPGIVVIQEAWGVNEQIEDVTRRIAAAGYVALAPDLYAVKVERPPALSRERIAEVVAFMQRLPQGTMMNPGARDAELAKLPEIDRQQISESFGRIFASASPDRLKSIVAPLRRAVRYLRSERSETQQQKVGCVGFCMGGGLSALLACEEPELAAAAMFYGSAPPVERVANINCPVIAFYGEKDQRINAGTKAFQEAMRKSGKSYEHHVYQGASHAFFNDDGPSYDVHASRDSFARLVSFFLKNLGE
ncbi:MAG: dienelactone hydrolase family protein [Spirochaetia bacterium]